MCGCTFKVIRGWAWDKFQLDSREIVLGYYRLW